MESLATLAAREADCIRAIENASGTIEYTGTQLEVIGAYDEYLSIHREYANMLSTDSSQEALKRALFIQWFSLTEPAFLSGINVLDPHAELAVLTHLDLLLKDGQTDDELTDMLRYYTTWEYVFQRAEFRHLHALQSFVTSWMSTSYCPTAPPLHVAEMAGRGQMGRYWLSWGGHEFSHIGIV